MAVTAKKINGAQRKWLQDYEGLTGFEPMHQAEIDDGTMSFAEVFRRNVHWYESHTSDMYLRISRAPDGAGIY